MQNAINLIVSGDDFGASRKVNDAIIRAYREGVLTSASLMANGAAFDHAVDLAKAHPGLGIGVHISLIRGKPVLPSTPIGRITDRDGNFFMRPILTGLKYFFDPKIRIPLRMEAEAQIRKFLAAGLRPTHLDGHLHLHIHPSVLEILLPLARKYGIAAIRLPMESFRRNIHIDSKHILLKAMYALIYSLLCIHAKKAIRSYGLAWPDTFFGLLSAGSMNEAYVLGVLKNLSPGITEIGMHPALGVPPELRRWAPDYDYHAELEAICSTKVKETILRRNIMLTDFRIFSGSRSDKNSSR